MMSRRRLSEAATKKQSQATQQAVSKYMKRFKELDAQFWIKSTFEPGDDQEVAVIAFLTVIDAGKNPTPDKVKKEFIKRLQSNKLPDTEWSHDILAEVIVYMEELKTGKKEMNMTTFRSFRQYAEGLAVNTTPMSRSEIAKAGADYIKAEHPRKKYYRQIAQLALDLVLDSRMPLEDLLTDTSNRVRLFKEIEAEIEDHFADEIANPPRGFPKSSWDIKMLIDGMFSYAHYRAVGKN